MPGVKILVSADMEGATGVTWPADCEPGSPEWQRCRPMFTGDVNAALAGLFDGGAAEVLVNEAHSTMRNLLLEQLDERATMITGRHKDLSMVEGIQDGAVDGVVFLGYHTGAGEEAPSRASSGRPGRPPTVRLPQPASICRSS
jgi:D-amino peptidase